MHQLIRFLLLAAMAFAPAACSTFDTPKPTLPQVDLTNAKWQKLSPKQPDSNPLRAAIVERNEKIGATRVVLKVPPGFTVPPYWLTAQGTYTVLKGTFVFKGHDGYGSQTVNVQGPGAFAITPPNLIQDIQTKPGEEGLLYITVYGDWSPNFLKGAFSGPELRLRAGS
jgi:hypothetical protein